MSATPNDARGGARRIVVADDNVDAADSLAVMLELLGHSVRTAHDGLAAVEAVAQFSPDVVLLDIGMPGIDGLEAARRIRRLPGGARIRLVALTGWGQAGDREATDAAGFDRHLVKPLAPETLEEIVSG